MSMEAIIIGAGPAGLTAAFELLERTEIRPLVFEETCDIGGISKTVNYKGNRLDIGGHRFISKSARVMSWWKEILPQEGSLYRGLIGTYPFFLAHTFAGKSLWDALGNDPAIRFFFKY